MRLDIGTARREDAAERRDVVKKSMPRVEAGSECLVVKKYVNQDLRGSG